MEGSSGEQTNGEKSAICEFYKQGKCRFGDECHNLHTGPEIVASATPAKGRPKKNKSDLNNKPKSMKTALDVIKRIQWDEMLPAESFTIGYLDRFTGIVEDPFTKFSNWGNLADADCEALAIPQHRIEYFKYRGTKVWDKKSRLDLIFGSSGDNEGKSFEDWMYVIDDRLKEKAINRATFDDDSSNCESSDDDEVHIEIEENIQAICKIPEEERSTHFIAIRISNPDIIKVAKSIQEDIVKHEDALSDCCMGLGLFHVTLGMLRLDGIDGSNEAVAMLEAIKPRLQELSKTLKLRIQGLDTFGQRVLFAKVLPEPEGDFWELASLVRDAIAKTSDKVNVTNKFELTPHMTLVKVNRPIARLRKSKYLPSAFYENHVDATFGEQKVDNLQLCILEATTRYDGFYRTLAELKL